jgi:hypothetical protein
MSPNSAHGCTIGSTILTSNRGIGWRRGEMLAADIFGEETLWWHRLVLDALESLMQQNRREDSLGGQRPAGQKLLVQVTL